MEGILIHINGYSLIRSLKQFFVKTFFSSLTMIFPITRQVLTTEFDFDDDDIGTTPKVTPQRMPGL